MQRSILRILDANANRAREALRVLEDYARFVLDDAELSAPLKQIRHDLADALSPIVGEAILHRDTPGDVGTDTKMAGELQRSGVSHVITAAAKRLGEALRAIEEYLKIEHPDRAATVETLRYRFYELEMRLARTLRPRDRFKPVRLYVLVTESLCRRGWLETAEAAVRGGADCLQLREKDLESGELLRRAGALVELCRRHDVLCIVNDRPDIAMLSDADGVHLGQGDLAATEVRKLVGPRMLVGVSTHNLEQAKQALRDGADYIGVGPVFPSQTKPRDILPGLEYARAAAEQVPLATVAIAGIAADNVEQVLATGVQAVAVSSAIISQADPRGAAQRLKAAISATGGSVAAAQGVSGDRSRPERSASAPAVDAG